MTDTRLAEIRARVRDMTAREVRAVLIEALAADRPEDNEWDAVDVLDGIRKALGSEVGNA